MIYLIGEILVDCHLQTAKNRCPKNMIRDLSKRFFQNLMTFSPSFLSFLSFDFSGVRSVHFVNVFLFSVSRDAPSFLANSLWTWDAGQKWLTNEFPCAETRE
jgi:hypothetical protein